MKHFFILQNHDNTKRNKLSINMKKSVDEQFLEIYNLMDSIESKNMEVARDSIQLLIKKRVKVKVTLKEIKAICDAHNYCFPNETCKFHKADLIKPVICEKGHKFCQKCIEKYVINKFNIHKLHLNQYNCMYCEFFQVPNTLLLNEEPFFQILYKEFGYDAININKC